MPVRSGYATMVRLGEFRSFGRCQVGQVGEVSLDQVRFVHSGQEGQFRKGQAK